MQAHQAHEKNKQENMQTLSPQTKSNTQDHLKNRMKIPVFQASVIKKNIAASAENSSQKWQTFEGCCVKNVHKNDISKCEKNVCHL